MEVSDYNNAGVIGSAYLAEVRRLVRKTSHTDMIYMHANAQYNDLIVLLQPLVISLATSLHYRAGADTWLDLIQAGNVELLTAVRSWQPHKGSTLTTWCYMPIKRGIIREFEINKQPSMDALTTGFDDDENHDRDAVDMQEHGIDDSAAILESNMQVHDALQHLTRRQAQAVKLVIVDGYTEAEAGLAMGISQQSINRLIVKAKNNLKGVLD